MDYVISGNVLVGEGQHISGSAEVIQAPLSPVIYAVLIYKWDIDYSG